MKENRLDVWIAAVLAAGTAVSAFLIGTGVVGSYLVGWLGSLSGATVAATDPTDFSDLWPRLLALQPLALSQAGLVLLIATPVVRVAITALGFARQHDRLYAGLSLLVLAMLAVGFALGSTATAMAP